MRAARPLGTNAGLRISGNRSFPGLLFALNGRPYEFNQLPGGWDLNASAHYDSPTAGHFKAFVNGLGDSVGVHIDSMAFGGFLRSSAASNLATLGTRPVWARNGRELFYVDAVNTLTSVPVQTTGSTFIAGNAAKVFDTKYAMPVAFRTYDVSPDGQRFLMSRKARPTRRQRQRASSSSSTGSRS